MGLNDEYNKIFPYTVFYNDNTNYYDFKWIRFLLMAILDSTYLCIYVKNYRIRTEE